VDVAKLCDIALPDFKVSHLRTQLNSNKLFGSYTSTRVHGVTSKGNGNLHSNCRELLAFQGLDFMELNEIFGLVNSVPNCMLNT
jgi:hypothetical protein